MPFDAPVWRSAATSELREGESLLFMASARTMPGDTGHSFTLMPFGTLFRWGRRLHQHAAARQASQVHGFPLRPRMIWAVTDKRVVVWASARRPGAKPVGDYDRGAIREARRPTVGGAWRTVHLSLADGQEVQVQVGGDAADRLAAELGSTE